MAGARAGVVAVTLVAAGLALAATGLADPQMPTGWDGVNPFTCELQQAGFGPTGPHPDADPYCIEFDKRKQNVDQLGVVDFLSNEPARVAAASDKCFYFQSDHWRGSVVQSDGTTKTYEWDGHYYFDKARAEGGAWVTNFNVNGHTGDPRQVPGIPPEYARYMGPGTGGITTRNGIPADPGCAAKAAAGAAAPVYAPAPPRGCFTAGGTVARDHLGPIALGDASRHVRDLLGPPARVARGFLRYCQTGAGKYLVGIAHGRVAIVLVTNRAYRSHGVQRGTGAAEVRAAFRQARARFRQGDTRVLETRPGSGVLVGVRHGAVRFLAVYDRRVLAGSAALRAALRRSQ
jgi:hypothetical protein